MTLSFGCQHVTSIILFSRGKENEHCSVSQEINICIFKWMLKKKKPSERGNPWNYKLKPWNGFFLAQLWKFQKQLIIFCFWLLIILSRDSSKLFSAQCFALLICENASILSQFKLIVACSLFVPSCSLVWYEKRHFTFANI